ncbi:hypothetical protein TNIN_321211 [Trichonephila inaurata madagascariensis]|uniref:Uncharacterized protein n=1 Tax=Trichonephila inaurata madagascariensis TaxID=2747483 RepID=A0A8X6KI63_9ARAC|nr:hypothetical protein TNIN_321211 [Trichonephila inaurata madagascariensis]
MGYGRFGINVHKGVLWKESLSIQTVIRGSKTIQHETSWRFNRAPSCTKGIARKMVCIVERETCSFQRGNINGERRCGQTGNGQTCNGERPNEETPNIKWGNPNKPSMQWKQAKHAMETGQACNGNRSSMK